MTLTETERQLRLEQFDQRRRQYRLNRALGNREPPPDDIRAWNDELARQTNSWFKVSLITMVTGVFPPRQWVEQTKAECRKRLDAIALGEPLNGEPLDNELPSNIKLLADRNR